MRVAELWRYPVKTLAGEKLSRVRISALGIEGDRVVHVKDEDGHVITARSQLGFWVTEGRLARTVSPSSTESAGTLRRLAVVTEIGGRGCQDGPAGACASRTS